MLYGVFPRHARCRLVAQGYERDFLEPFVSANRHDGHPVAIQAEAGVGAAAGDGRSRAHSAAHAASAAAHAADMIGAVTGLPTDHSEPRASVGS